MSHHQAGTEQYSLRRVRLEMARSKEHVEGAEGYGYDFVAPLDGQGHLSVDGWHVDRGRGFVHRLEKGIVTERGLLVHKAGGEGGGTWAFDYPDVQGVDDEDRGYHFASRSFVPGEYVSFKEHDGVTRTYRIKAVGPA